MDIKPVKKSKSVLVEKKSRNIFKPRFLKDKYYLSLTILFIFICGYFIRSYINSPMRTIQTDSYQSLFLTNGQVYFGKIIKYTSDYVQLTNVYYLQTQQPLQSTTSPNATSSGNTPTTNSKPLLSLAKLGSEIHGPQDSMFVPRNQVQYWENLKNTGKIVQAIHDYQKGP
jgi:hypothetical protein